MTEEFNHSDRREFGRRRSCIHAYVLVPGRPPTPCVVRNYSEAGAMLVLSQLVEPPYTFAIRIGSNGDEIRCEARHQHGNRIGVRFLGGNVGETLASALGGIVKTRKSRPGSAVVASEPLLPHPRVTGNELRRTVLKQKLA